VATVLAVYKPRGLTPYGWRKQRERIMMHDDAGPPPPANRLSEDEYQ
jgi:hypothetical protein